MPTTIKDLEKLGYTIGLAAGGVAAEEDALTSAKDAADPAIIADQANTAVAETVKALTTLGKIPEDENERLQMFAQMGEQAYKILTSSASEKVAFHEQALAIAHEMPDTWHVAGPGVEIYVDCKPDGSGWDDDQQANLDALADQDQFNERAYQVDNPEAMQAASDLNSCGVTIGRPTPGSDEWEAEGRTYTGAELPAFLEEVQARPPTPTTAEKITAALADAPEISAETKQALVAALEPPKT